MQMRGFCLVVGLMLLAGSNNAGIAQPPLSPKAALGKKLFFEAKLSQPDGQSCATCHSPTVGFSDADKEFPTSRGVLHGRFGSRNAPTAAYSSFSPPLHYDTEGETYVGGLFWDGRVDNLTEQAQKPFLNPLEMHNPGINAVIAGVVKAGLSAEFKKIYGPHSLDPANASATYVDIADAIAAFERSREVNQFTSKFDYYLAGHVRLTDQEAAGLALYNGKANCFACHPSTVVGDEPFPLFTDFTYDNIGIPKNYQNPFLYLPKDLNPDGINFIDLGLATTVAGFDPNSADQAGRFKVPTLRNMELTAPYGHNGYFGTMEEIVHFYNTRDVDGEGWDEAEVPATVNHDELGNPGMTDEEEAALVAFLKTLTDGYKLKRH